MKRQPIIGIMGPGIVASTPVLRDAFRIGYLVAQAGWITLTGGVNRGVMDAVSRGAKKGRGLTIGIIPRPETKISRWVDIPIVTGMGSGRNVINALSSDAVVVCGINPGTTTEVAYAIQFKKPVIFFKPNKTTLNFFFGLGKKNIYSTKTADATISLLRTILKKRS